MRHALYRHPIRKLSLRSAVMVGVSAMALMASCATGIGAARATEVNTHAIGQFGRLVGEAVQSSLGSGVAGRLDEPIRSVSLCLGDRAGIDSAGEDPISSIGCFSDLLPVGEGVGEMVVDSLPLQRLFDLLALESKPHDPQGSHATATTGSSDLFGSSGSSGSTSSGEAVAPTNGQVTSSFGDGRNHQGMDIGNSLGAPILAVGDGEIINSGPADGFGLWVRIRLADGTVGTYGHNDANAVTVGQRVRKGQQVATVGNRGNSTGPHLHFEVADPSGTTVDPEKWLADRGVVLPSANPGDQKPATPPPLFGSLS